MLKKERNMKIHFVAALGVILFSALLQVSSEDMLWIFLAIALVMITEILNTFFEKLLDLLNPEYNVVVKRLKDMSAAGVLMASIFAVVVALAVFGKRFGVNLYWLSEVIFLVYLVMVIVLSLGGDNNEKDKSGSGR